MVSGKGGIICRETRARRRVMYGPRARGVGHLLRTRVNARGNICESRARGVGHLLRAMPDRWG